MRFSHPRFSTVPTAPKRTRPLVLEPLGAALVAMLLALAAILYPLPASAAPPVDPTKFQQVTLAKGVAEVGEPMSLAVLPDRSVLHTARDGTLRRHRRRRQHHGRRQPPRLHPRRGGPAGRRASTRASPPTGSSTSTTRRR